jgi:hypothetical protein
MLSTTLSQCTPSAKSRVLPLYYANSIEYIRLLTHTTNHFKTLYNDTV